MSALQKIIELKGSQAAMAAVVGQRQQSVGYWLKNGLPAEHVLTISADVKFEVTPHQLRPDLYPHPEDGLPDELRGKILPLETTEAIPQPNLQGAA